MKTRWIYAVTAIVAIIVTTYPLWYAYLSGQSGMNGQYLCAPLIPCQPPSAGVEACLSTCVVDIANSTFTPGIVDAVVGATIVWMNHDGFAHTTSPFNQSAWQGSVIPAGGTLTVVIGKNISAGPYYYTCNIHPAMIGEVLVSPTQPAG
jgi:plastocyanin